MPWDPMRELTAWQERLGRLVSQNAEPWSPAIDIYETPDKYVVVAEVPGLRREQIDLALEQSRLTIRAQRSTHLRPAEEVVHFHQVERGYGGFVRTFEFASAVDVDRVSADLTRGVLSITLPKVAPPAARRIEVG
jgi:HSP20 family protein